MYGEFQPQLCKSQNLFLFFQSFNTLIHGLNISLSLRTNILNHLFVFFLHLFDLMSEITFWSVNLIVFLFLHYETALVDDWDVIGLAGLGEVRVAGKFAAAVILVEELGVLALVG